MTLLFILLAIVSVGAIIFGVLCWLFPDWLETWAGDEADAKDPQ
jgi:hypothetical protein